MKESLMNIGRNMLSNQYFWFLLAIAHYDMIYITEAAIPGYGISLMISGVLSMLIGLFIAM